MYRTCSVHAPIPCSVMDEQKLFMAHDRYLLPEGEDNATAADQKDADRAEDE